MTSLILAPFTVMRKKIWLVFVPAIPILFLLAFMVTFQGINDTASLLNQIDYYLGGDLHLSAADLTTYHNVSTNIQLPIIRLGGIAEKTNITELLSPDPTNFVMIFIVLFLAFLSYAVIARGVYSVMSNQKVNALGGINLASIVLCIAAAVAILFISSFSLAGFKLLLIISFGIYFTFSIPYTAAGQPLGESLFQGFKFISAQLGKIVTSYIGGMGAAMMVPIALLIFTTPLLINMEPAVGNMLKIILGLLSVVIALFYQMALCAAAVFQEN